MSAKAIQPFNFQALGVAYSLDERGSKIHASFPMNNRERVVIREQEKEFQAELKQDWSDYEQWLLRNG